MGILSLARSKLSSAIDSITIVAAALDIRSLLFATDSVDASGSDVTVSNEVNIEDLTFAKDAVDASGSDINIVDPTDTMTGALETISYEHHEIHSGSHFYVCNFEILDDRVSTDFAVTTPDTAKWSHMTFEIEGTSQTEFHIYEASAVTGGTAAIPLNNNRNSATTSVLTLVKDPTVNTLGNLIFAQSKGLAGTTPSKAGTVGVIVRESEIILKQNTTYIFRITSRQDDNIVSYCGEWYEHTNP